MSPLLGIDLGTSSVKCVLAAEDGHITAISEREYPIQSPQPNWAEQDPETWWRKTSEAVREMISKTNLGRGEIQAIGLSGQMHGTVFLGKDGASLRPAIIWADQRSQSQCQQVYDAIGHIRLGEIAGSGVFPGFMLASLLWVRDHQPSIWEGIYKVVFPKDYVRMRLTGETATEITDASGGLLVNNRERTWSEEIIETLSLPTNILPPILGSCEIAGRLTKEAAEILGVSPGIPVVSGGADQATGILGTGMVTTDLLSVTIGTGGQLVSLLDAPLVDPDLRAHTFCHAVESQWYALGTTLSAGLSFRWLRDSILREPIPGAYDRMVNHAATISPGSEGLIFLPYLVGERKVKQTQPPTGMYHGLTIRHERAHMIRATMEGIIFSMRRVFDILVELGIKPKKIIASGGGARSSLWCQIMADIFQTPVTTLKEQEQSAVGAVILAGLGVGMYRNPAEACQALVGYCPDVTPGENARTIYPETYERFCDLYSKLR